MLNDPATFEEKKNPPEIKLLMFSETTTCNILITAIGTLLVILKETRRVTTELCITEEMPKFPVNMGAEGKVMLDSCLDSSVLMLFKNNHIHKLL